MKKLFENRKKIRLGIWGLGRGRSFIRQCEELNFEIAAGCDLNKTMCREFQKICPGAFITCDEDEFLKQDLDVVLVATFFFNHARDSIKVLRSGKHVISEISAFFTPAEGAALVDAVEESGKLYCLAENATDHFVKKLWAEGFFGELAYAEFDYAHECRALSYSYLYGDPILPGNTAHSWRSWLNFHYYCTHSLGAAMEITGTRPVRVMAPESRKMLPGYLPQSEMGSMKPSFVIMDNGGVIRNLTGASTSDSHNRRIWGTRAAVDLTEKTPVVTLGQSGEGLKVKLSPPEDELNKLAAKAGHGGGDFWIIYHFAEAFYNGVPLFWDIYRACDVTLTGIMAVKSEYSGGLPIEVPDFRDKEIRRRYSNDNFSQQHVDPRKIFPDDQDEKETRKFSLIMNDLDRAWSNNGVPLLISALEGVKLYSYITDPGSRLAVQNQVRLLLRNWNTLETALKSARKLGEQYPESPAGKALLSFCEAACPERMADPAALRQELSEWLISADLPPERQLIMSLDRETINRSCIPAVPENLVLRTYKESDATGYIKLMQRSGFDYWDQQTLQQAVANSLEEGIFFLEEKSTKRLVASAMAHRSKNDTEEPDGTLGWVGVDPEFRGQHLSAIVCQAVMERFRRENYGKARLYTDDFRLPAIKTYYALGWRPVIDTVEMQQRWEIICKKLGLELPENLLLQK